MLARGRRARLAPATAARWPHVPRAAGVAVLLVSLALLARAAWRDASALGGLLSGLRPLPALGALASTVVASALVIALWRGLLARLGPRLAPVEAAAVLSLSYLSRYVPGAVWSFAAVGYLGRRRGVPYRAGAFSLLLALALQGLTAILWAAPVVVGGLRPELARLWPPFLLLAGVALALVAPATARRLAGPLGLPRPPGAPPWWGGSAALVSGWLGYWALSGLALALLLRALGGPAPPLPTLIGIGALAWLGGLLGSAAPAGLGVQDAALVLLLGAVVPQEVALAAALLARALKTLNDGLYGLAGLLLYRRARLGDPGAASDAGAPPGASDGRADG